MSNYHMGSRGKVSAVTWVEGHSRDKSGAGEGFKSLRPDLEASGRERLSMGW